MNDDRLIEKRKLKEQTKQNTFSENINQNFEVNDQTN